MTDAQFAGGRQLNDITTIHVHHASQFGHYDVQKSFKVDCGREREREAIDDRLTRLVHFDLAFK